MNLLKRFFMLVLTAAFFATAFAQTDSKALDWYPLPGPVIAMTSDGSSSRVTVEASIGYEKGNEKALALLVQNKTKIISFFRSWIFSKSAKDLNSRSKEEITKEIIDGMNAKIFSESLVLDINFIQFEIE